MAGIYIHIPFCKSKCTYCDFYSITQLSLIQKYVDALCIELTRRSDYIKEKVSTLYIGGGTPSLLSSQQLEQIVRTIETNFTLNDPLTEVTLEANPDDITSHFLESLHHTPINRISLGVQTFNDNSLRKLNRRHTAKEAIKAIELCYNSGFTNISLDLIYGLPYESTEEWVENLHQALELQPNHISAYHLIYESGTKLMQLLRSKQVKEINETESLKQFKLLIEILASKGYEHYEISNFCKSNSYGIHNTSYWKGVPYLGCGPSAHSFDGKSREWNSRDLTHYISSLQNGLERPFEREELTLNTQYNEFIITQLRTKWGVNKIELKEKFGASYSTYFLREVVDFLKRGLVKQEENTFSLTEEGIFISDAIMSDLLWVEE